MGLTRAQLRELATPITAIDLDRMTVHASASPPSVVDAALDIATGMPISHRWLISGHDHFLGISTKRGHRAILRFDQMDPDHLAFLAALPKRAATDGGRAFTLQVEGVIPAKVVLR